MKQVIVLRTDLNMRKGKMCAQAAHASMKVILDRCVNRENKYMMFAIDDIEEWINGTFTKIVVGVESEIRLKEIYQDSKALCIPCSIIQDIGKTEFNGIPTYTAVAVGPGNEELINKVTGHLKLL